MVKVMEPYVVTELVRELAKVTELGVADVTVNVPL
jgi:hypothetical protein